MPIPVRQNEGWSLEAVRHDSESYGIVATFSCGIAATGGCRCHATTTQGSTEGDERPAVDIA